MGVQRLDWDSEFFGLRVARLECERAMNRQSLEHCLKASNADVVYIMIVEGSHIEMHRTLSDVGARMVDNKLVYWKRVDPEREFPAGIAAYRGERRADLDQLALVSGRYSRFRRDPGFASRANAMYLAWMDRIIHDRFELVLVRWRGETICAMVTVKTIDKEAWVGLLSVERSSRGGGLGRQLMYAAECEAAVQGARRLLVVTQGDNEAAVGLYEGCGFSLKESKTVYHWWR